LARSKKVSRQQTEPAAPPPDPRWLIAIAIAAVAGFVILSAGDIVTTSPTSDETTHLIAGYSYLTQHDFRLNPEHPPLLKAFAALPMLAMNVWPAHLREPADGKTHFAIVREAWAMSILNPQMAQWSTSQYVLYGMRDAALARVGGDPTQPPTDVAYARSDYLNESERFFTFGRAMMLLVALALAAAIFWWSFRLWGLAGAVLSLLLYCFDPNFIAHSGLVTTDVGAACLMFISIYCFWRACLDFTPWNVALFAIVFALAQLAKFSAVLLIPMVLLAGIIEIARRKEARPIVIAIASAAVATVVLIWAAYDFRYSTAPDPDAAAKEAQTARANLQLPVLDAPNLWATGHLPLRDALEQWVALKRLKTEMPNGYTEADLRNAKRTTPMGLAQKLLLFADEHKLFPESFIYGYAWTGASSVTRISYLRGDYSTYGFRSFFFWTFLYKTPILAMILMAAGVVAALRSKKPDVAFLVWPLIIYTVFALSTALNIGHRHFFPVLPFVYTLAGALGSTFFARWRRALIGAALLAITANVSLLPRPASVINRHLSYLNEFAGGPVAGWDKLSDSNFDWGQDIKRLGIWLRENHVEEPIDLVVFGNADPRYYGIRYNNLRKADYPLPQKHGVFAISQFDYLGLFFDREHRTWYRDYLERTNAKRIGTAGYSIFIYRIDQRP
jgi:4-amino-4-deoxy-L-arabinose transferase-like glycosyltransferase